MGAIAASGGYYISSLADKIVAQPTTITGSIGVYTGKVDMSEFYRKLGYNKVTNKRGKYSDIFSESRPATNDEKRLIHELISDHYRGFLARVSQGRKMSPEDINKIARGRVWSGTDAKKVGLVDELGGLLKAIKIAKELAGIKKEENERIILYPRRKGFWDIIFGNPGKETIKAGEDNLLSRLLPEEATQMKESNRHE